MFKKILVPTDGSDHATTGIRYAVAIAKRYGAVLHGLHIVDIKLLEGPFLRDISASLGTAPYVNYQGNIAMILEERGRAALDWFQDICEEAGVRSEVTLVTGIVPRCIIEHSELTDLIVMGRGGEHGQWLEGLAGSTTEAVVRRSHQPVLITSKDLFAADRFIIAYDGSPHAKRALHTAAQISVDWQMRCHVLVVAGKTAPALIKDAQSYLQSYEVDVDYVTREGDPSETIIDYLEECRADLLVMGAYGHTKVRELVVGSTTAYAINHAPCPVLLLR